MVTQLNPAGDFSSIPQVNILDNAGFEIWQRETSFSSPSNSSYTLDRWQTSVNSTPTFTVSKELSIVDSGLSSCKLDITNAGVSNSLYLRQIFENAVDFKNKTLTFTVRVRSNSNKCRLEMFDGVTESFSSPHSGGGSFETLSMTVNIGSGGLNQVGIGFTGSGFAPVVSTSYFDSAMLIVGAQPINFIPENPQVSLARCQRFFQVVGGINGYIIVYGQATNTNLANWVVPLSVTMRASPSTTVNNPTNWVTGNTAGTPIALLTLVDNGSRPNFVALSGTVSTGLVAGNACILATANANATLFISADL